MSCFLRQSLPFAAWLSAEWPTVMYEVDVFWLSQSLHYVMYCLSADEFFGSANHCIMLCIVLVPTSVRHNFRQCSTYSSTYYKLGSVSSASAMPNKVIVASPRG